MSISRTAICATRVHLHELAVPLVMYLHQSLDPNVSDVEHGFGPHYQMGVYVR
jgi:hypothetical protein